MAASTPAPPPPQPAPCGSCLGAGGHVHTSTEGGVYREWWTACGSCR